MAQMRSFLIWWKRFAHDTGGAPLIEYALLAAILGAGLLAFLSILGTSVSDALAAVGQAIDAVIGVAGDPGDGGATGGAGGAPPPPHDD